MFHLLFRVAKSLVIFELIKMSENAHDPRKSVDLADVEKFECLHLEAVRRVHDEKDQIGDLRPKNIAEVMTVCKWRE